MHEVKFTQIVSELSEGNFDSKNCSIPKELRRAHASLQNIRVFNAGTARKTLKIGIYEVEQSEMRICQFVGELAKNRHLCEHTDPTKNNPTNAGLFLLRSREDRHRAIVELRKDSIGDRDSPIEVPRDRSGRNWLRNDHRGHRRCRRA